MFCPHDASSLGHLFSPKLSPHGFLPGTLEVLACVDAGRSIGLHVADLVLTSDCLADRLHDVLVLPASDTQILVSWLLIECHEAGARRVKDGQQTICPSNQCLMLMPVDAC